MSYKFKSLVYFVCFLASSFAYYAMDNDSQFENKNSNEEIATLSMERVTMDKPTVLK
jgi:hypothetical protein